MLFTIKNDQLEVQISSIGAELKSVKQDGFERMHNDGLYWNRTAPILFPCIGKLINDETNISGVNYPLPKHGFLRDANFEVINQTDDNIALVLHENEDTLKLYPFAFEVLVKYFLIGNTLRSEIIVKNTETELLPFNLGLHPAFRVPLNEDEKFEDYTIDFSIADDYEVPGVNLQNGTIEYNHIVRSFKGLKTLPLNYHDYDGDAIVLPNIKMNEISLLSPKNQNVIFKFNGFSTLGIWTPNTAHANFICLEPWHGSADPSDHDGIFINKKDIITLVPNDTKLFSYSLTFTK